MGPVDPAVRHLALGIRSTAHRHFATHVLPLVARHWPAILGTEFGDKLRIGACDLYASAPYTALFCGTHRPLLVRIFTGLGNALPLPASALGRIGRGAMVLLGRFFYKEEHRRIALISAFIVIVDHVFDHCLTAAPRARGACLEAVIAGRTPPKSPELALTRALAVAMAEGLTPEERVGFTAALDRVYAWIRAEVRALDGEPDPLGCGHRRAGVEGTIDGLLFPVARFAGPAARAWMVDVSMFVQIMDDYLDLEADRDAGRHTPATDGSWTITDVAGAWQATTAGLEALVRAAGLRSPRYVRFMRGLYVYMMVEVVQAMIRRPADGLVPAHPTHKSGARAS
jgi:hypothetical protein